MWKPSEEKNSTFPNESHKKNTSDILYFCTRILQPSYKHKMQSDVVPLKTKMSFVSEMIRSFVLIFYNLSVVIRILLPPRHLLLLS